MANQKQIKCAVCKYVRADKSASEKNWTAYECGNPDSEYYKALLNVTINSEMQDFITWTGCPLGRRE